VAQLSEEKGSREKIREEKKKEEGEKRMRKKNGRLFKKKGPPVCLCREEERRDRSGWDVESIWKKELAGCSPTVQGGHQVAAGNLLLHRIGRKKKSSWQSTPPREGRIPAKEDQRLKMRNSGP